LFAPYIPLDEPTAVGGWTLFPTLGDDAAQVIESEEDLIPNPLIRRAARRLVDAYGVEDGSRGRGSQRVVDHDH
jgi:hypothetical protein